MSASDPMIKDAVAHALAGEAGRLELGGDLLRWHEKGRSTKEFREKLKDQGVDLPTDSRLSTYKSAYKAWVVDAKIPVDHSPFYNKHIKDINGNLVPLRLTGVTVDKLYALKDDVTAENALDVLSWAYTHTDAEHRVRKSQAKAERDTDRDSTPSEQPDVEVRVKSLRLNADSYDHFLGLLDRIRNTQGNPHISKAQAFDFMVGQFDSDSLSDEGLSFLWRQAHGEVTEEELEAAEDIDLEITDD